MTNRKFWSVISIGLVVGFIFRYWLGFIVFPNQGFAWDLATFGSWIDTIKVHGFEAYAVDPGINYPPVFADILALLIWIGDLTGVPAINLIKFPSIIADLGVAVVLALTGRKWFTDKVGLIAAILYLVIPVTWYNSAIWGQVDSLAALPMLIAVVLMIDKKPEWSVVFFMIAVLTKPQGALILLILLPVFIGQLIQKELRWRRALSTIAAGFGSFILIAVPWSLESYVPNAVSKIPVVGDILGLAWQYFSTAGLFPVLTVNAYNAWATVGKIPMAHQFQDGRVYWLTDNFLVFGIPAGIIGTGLFAIVAIVIFWLLLKKHSATHVLTAFSLLLVAFFALPTRVHERYLVQAFAVLAIVWAVKLWQRAALVVLALANTVNLHAILAANLFVETVPIVSKPVAMASGFAPPESSRVVIQAVESPEYYGISWVRMDAQWAREEWLVWVVIFIHSAAFVVLLAQYLSMNGFLANRLKARKVNS